MRVQNYEIMVELATGYTLNVVEAARSADEARNNLLRKLQQTGWRAARDFTLGTPAAVDVRPTVAAPQH